jgi:catechol 2,3-dioxygenase-like lactoylglutathione lyase family enzyme
MTINHINIVVKCMDASLAFYVGLLGMRETFRCELEGGWIDTVTGLEGAKASCVFVQPLGGGCRIELLHYHSPTGDDLTANSQPNTGGIRHFALDVQDLDGLIEQLKVNGTPVFSAPVTVPFRIVDNIQKRLCYTLDPDGVIVEFSQHHRD